MRTKFSAFAWGHAILYVAALIHIRPIGYYKFFHLKLAFNHEPNIFHLRIFGCAVYIPILLPQRIKMGPQKRLRIYVGYDSPFIVRYLELISLLRDL